MGSSEAGGEADAMATSCDDVIACCSGPACPRGGRFVCRPLLPRLRSWRRWKSWWGREIQIEGQRRAAMNATVDPESFSSHGFFTPKLTVV